METQRIRISGNCEVYHALSHIFPVLVDDVLERGCTETLLKGQHANFIQYGLADDGDIELTHWRATIIGPQGKQLGEFIYMLDVTCGPNYPEQAPRVKFTMPQIRMDAVSGDGTVNLSRLEPRFAWNSRMDIADVLCAIRDNMSSDKVCRDSAALGESSY